MLRSGVKGAFVVGKGSWQPPTTAASSAGAAAAAVVAPSAGAGSSGDVKITIEKTKLEVACKTEIQIDCDAGSLTKTVRKRRNAENAAAADADDDDDAAVAATGAAADDAATAAAGTSFFRIDPQVSWLRPVILVTDETKLVSQLAHDPEMLSQLHAIAALARIFRRSLPQNISQPAVAVLKRVLRGELRRPVFWRVRAAAAVALCSSDSLIDGPKMVVRFLQDRLQGSAVVHTTASDAGEAAAEAVATALARAGGGGIVTSVTAAEAEDLARRWSAPAGGRSGIVRTRGANGEVILEDSAFSGVDAAARAAASASAAATGGRSYEVKYVIPNRFSNPQEMLLNKSLLRTLALYRDAHGHSPREVVDLLEKLLCGNSNTLNPLDDTYWRAGLIESLGLLALDKAEARAAPADSAAPRVFNLLHSALERDRILGSHDQAVTAAALQALAAQRLRLPGVDQRPLMAAHYTLPSHSRRVRLAAMQVLVAEWLSLANREFLLTLPPPQLKAYAERSAEALKGGPPLAGGAGSRKRAQLAAAAAASAANAGAGAAAEPAEAATKDPAYRAPTDDEVFGMFCPHYHRGALAVARRPLRSTAAAAQPVSTAAGVVVPPAAIALAARLNAAACVQRGYVGHISSHNFGSGGGSTGSATVSVVDSDEDEDEYDDDDDGGFDDADDYLGAGGRHGGRGALRVSGEYWAATLPCGPLPPSPALALAAVTAAATLRNNNKNKLKTISNATAGMRSVAIGGCGWGPLSTLASTSSFEPEFSRTNWSNVALSGLLRVLSRESDPGVRAQMAQVWAGMVASLQATRPAVLECLRYGPPSMLSLITHSVSTGASNVVLLAEARRGLCNVLPLFLTLVATQLHVVTLLLENLRATVYVAHGIVEPTEARKLFPFIERAETATPVLAQYGGLQKAMLNFVWSVDIAESQLALLFAASHSPNTSGTTGGSASVGAGAATMAATAAAAAVGDSGVSLLICVIELLKRLEDDHGKEYERVRNGFEAQKSKSDRIPKHLPFHCYIFINIIKDKDCNNTNSASRANARAGTPAAASGASTTSPSDAASMLQRMLPTPTANVNLFFEPFSSARLVAHMRTAAAARAGASAAANPHAVPPASATAAAAAAAVAAAAAPASVAGVGVAMTDNAAPATAAAAVPWPRSITIMSARARTLLNARKDPLFKSAADAAAAAAAAVAAPASGGAPVAVAVGPFGRIISPAASATSGGAGSGDAGCVPHLGLLWQSAMWPAIARNQFCMHTLWGAVGGAVADAALDLAYPAAALLHVDRNGNGHGNGGTGANVRGRGGKGAADDESDDDDDGDSDCGAGRLDFGIPVRPPGAPGSTAASSSASASTSVSASATAASAAAIAVSGSVTDREHGNAFPYPRTDARLRHTLTRLYTTLYGHSRPAVAPPPLVSARHRGIFSRVTRAITRRREKALARDAAALASNFATGHSNTTPSANAVDGVAAAPVSSKVEVPVWLLECVPFTDFIGVGAELSLGWSEQNDLQVRCIINTRIDIRFFFMCSLSNNLPLFYDIVSHNSLCLSCAQLSHFPLTPSLPSYSCTQGKAVANAILRSGDILRARHHDLTFEEFLARKKEHRGPGAKKSTVKLAFDSRSGEDPHGEWILGVHG